LLRDLLSAIGKLSFLKCPSPEITIMVVDNDEFASARAVCESSILPWPIRYAVESRRGITYARNRAIEEAGLVDFIAFIDDDEVPSPQWLDELLWARARFAADVVSGPVFPQYAPEIAPWVKQGGFFERRIGPTGTVRDACATNNVLIGTHVFRSVPGFDHSFALSGAEDTHFFLRIRQAGFKIVWSDEATVRELLPAERGRPAWILRRDYQTGNGWVFCETGLDPSLHLRAVRLLKALGHVVIGFVTAVWASLRWNRAALIHSLRRASLGAGMLSALAGYRFLAYQGAGRGLVPRKLSSPAQ
jgi:GT2 family glycosyltransferase